MPLFMKKGGPDPLEDPSHHWSQMEHDIIHNHRKCSFEHGTPRYTTGLVSGTLSDHAYTNSEISARQKGLDPA